MYEYMVIYKEVGQEILERKNSLRQLQCEEDFEDDQEEEEMPEDLADLTPEEQQRRIKVRAAYMMGLGTLLCILFADPMVGVLDEIGKRLVSSHFT